MDNNKEITVVKRKEDFANRKFKSGDIRNFNVTEALRNIYIEMHGTDKRIDKTICGLRKSKRLQWNN